MSDPRVRCTVAWDTAVLALLVALLAPAAAAQSTDDYRERVQQLEGRLEHIRQEHPRAMERDSLPGNLDTLRVGPFQLLTPPPERQFVQDVASQLRDSLSVVIRADTATLPSVTYLVRPYSRGPRVFGRQGVEVWGYRDQQTPGRERDSPESVASGILGMLRQNIAAALESALYVWLEGTLPLDTLTRIQARTIYVELATKPWSKVGACYEGRLDRCKEALAIGTGGAEAWYSAEERRQLVASSMTWDPAVQRDPGAALCANTGDEQSCLETLRLHPHLVNEPLSPMARQSLLRVALQSGGEGAFGRLMTEDTLSVQDRLARTAGLPVDSLIARWHEAIIAARPVGTVLSRSGGWTAFFWVVVLGVLAMRSTRWRVR